jgi:phospholipase C
MPGLADKIDHIVVLMLENRSFDCLLGCLYPGLPNFAGLTGNEFNSWTDPGGTTVPIRVWNDQSLVPGAMTIPDPDPGELFVDMNTQLFGLGNTPGGAAPPMSGFVDNYMRQPPADRSFDAHAPMHFFKPNQIEVLSELARSFAVCDDWHASAPCQTWPNRFFVHTATANGYVNNSPPRFPYLMPTIFTRLEAAGHKTHIYFHDIPQSITLANLWRGALERFRPIAAFWDDAERGDLPAYSFIEPRYFSDPVTGHLPNDQHPPHDIVYGEQLIAEIYNALRASPAWNKTLLVITYDEHGGCFDHVPPPAATAPNPGFDPEGFLFDRYGVRVPTVLVSPYITPGTILHRPATGMPAGANSFPFDHTSIIRTLRERFIPGGPALTNRDASAPSLDPVLALNEPTTGGPDRIDAPDHTPSAEEMQNARAAHPNDLQRSLCDAVAHLPNWGKDIAQHILDLQRALIRIEQPLGDEVSEAATFVRDRLGGFLGLA